MGYLSTSDKAKQSPTLPEMSGKCVTCGRKCWLKKMLMSERCFLVFRVFCFLFFFPFSFWGCKRVMQNKQSGGPCKKTMHTWCWGTFICMPKSSLSITIQTWVGVLAELLVISGAAQSWAFPSAENLRRLERLQVPMGNKPLVEIFCLIQIQKLRLETPFLYPYNVL